MEIYKKLSQIMSEIGCIGKNKVNETQKFKYRGIDDVMNALQPLLSKYGVIVVPDVLEHTREERQSKQGSLLIYSILKMKYTFYAEDGSSVCAVILGEGMDTGDKASNKAMAIAFKYACFQVFCIPTDEIHDPDKNSPQIKTLTTEENLMIGLCKKYKNELKATGMNNTALNELVGYLVKNKYSLEAAENFITERISLA